MPFWLITFFLSAASAQSNSGLVQTLTRVDVSGDVTQLRLKIESEMKSSLPCYSFDDPDLRNIEDFKLSSNSPNDPLPEPNSEHDEISFCSVQSSVVLGVTGERDGIKIGYHYIADLWGTGIMPTSFATNEPEATPTPPENTEIAPIPEATPVPTPLATPTPAYRYHPELTVLGGYSYVTATNFYQSLNQNFGREGSQFHLYANGYSGVSPYDELYLEAEGRLDAFDNIATNIDGAVYVGRKILEITSHTNLRFSFGAGTQKTYDPTYGIDFSINYIYKLKLINEADGWSIAAQFSPMFNESPVSSSNWIALTGMARIPRLGKPWRAGIDFGWTNVQTSTSAPANYSRSCYAFLIGYEFSDH
jgi:hypothetical protein